MYASKDMKNFINSFGSPHYFEKDAPYLPVHSKKDDLFYYEFKFYYINSGKYFMGIGASNLVKQITAQDYNRVKKLHLASKKRTKKFLQGSLF